MRDFGCCDRFARMKAETGDVGNGPAAPPELTTANGAGGILDKRQTMVLANFLDLAQSGRIAKCVNKNHGLGARGDFLF